MEDRGGEADVEVSAMADGAVAIRTRAPYAAEAVFGDTAEAANGLAGILAGAFVCGDPDSVCLHAGAARIGDRLVLVMGDSHAGKSSVSLHLSLRGAALFGDDRIAVRTAMGAPPAATCLGILPKARLPLPDDAGADYARFVAAHTAHGTGDAAYLGADIPGAARFGDRAPIGAIVLLQRRPGARPTLDPVPAAEMVRTLIADAYAPHLPAERLVEICSRIATGVEPCRLSFHNSGDAAQVLIDRFSGETP
jgi:hypothetical protein